MAIYRLNEDFTSSKAIHARYRPESAFYISYIRELRCIFYPDKKTASYVRWGPPVYVQDNTGKKKS